MQSSGQRGSTHATSFARDSKLKGFVGRLRTASAWRRSQEASSSVFSRSKIAPPPKPRWLGAKAPPARASRRDRERDRHVPPARSCSCCVPYHRQRSAEGSLFIDGSLSPWCQALAPRESRALWGSAHLHTPGKTQTAAGQSWIAHDSTVQGCASGRLTHPESGLSV
jgi:hypothetical protein